jgi:L-ascorbate metabolism protein UlaG (beta-lactamase superfamily)
MKHLFLVIGLMTSIVIKSQTPPIQIFKTAKGTLSIQPLVHASMVITWNKHTIYVDPYGGAELFQGQAAPDIILITDIHPDHLSPETLNSLELSRTKIIAPQAVIDQLPAHLKVNASVINNNEDKTEMGILVHAVPMYNLPESAESMHTKGRGNGYVLEMGGKRIYISGDTEDIAEMRALKKIDIAFVCMNLPYTMDVDQAAAGVRAFQPKIVYAYHYRGKDGLSDVEAFKKKVNDKNKVIEVRLLNWYASK